MEGPRERQARVASHLSDQGVFALVLEDFENLRSRSVRYLSGHPMDAILFVFADGRTVLVPWDVTMARERASVDGIIPYTGFQRSFSEAVAAVLEQNGFKKAGPARKVEISARTPYLRFKEFEGSLNGVSSGSEILCDQNGIDAFIAGMRAVKDPAETTAIRRAGEITNELIRRIDDVVRSSREPPTEVELAHFVEKEALALGAEGLGFETLAAGPGRSWGIHPFPAYSNGPFGGRGLSILDFGVTVEGYTSDVTLTFARGPLAPEQERMIALVEKAYQEAVSALRPGGSPQEPARKADEVFASAGWKMPHALGHGIGLDAHERPLVRNQDALPDVELLPGMVFTIEPGLYHPDHGGVRLENDFLVTGAGVEAITGSRIVRLE